MGKKTTCVWTTTPDGRSRRDTSAGSRNGYRRDAENDKENAVAKTRFAGFPRLVLGSLLSLFLAPVALMHAQGVKVIHQCAQSEFAPHKLIQNPADGMFYGTTNGGGAHYPNGSVFKMDSSGNMTTIYSFSGPDGSQPYAGLYLNSDDGLLYGTIFSGGNGDLGGVFKLDTSGGSFAEYLQPEECGVQPVAAQPDASFIKANDGNLYLPMSTCGAPGMLGTVNRIDTSLNETAISSFTDLQGGVFVAPRGHVVQGSDNKLYGMAAGDPFCCNRGGIYRVDLGGGDPETVHSFALGEGTTNSATSAPLVLATDGYFWGTTPQATDAMGSVLFTGTIFRVAQDGTFQTMHFFTGPDGAGPYTGLTQASDGNFYGVTSAGGKNDVGVIYRIDLAGNFAVLANIQDTDIGEIPSGEFLQGSDGKLYGTSFLGYYGYGSIYTVDLTQGITDIVPSSGPGAGGTAVTIDGTGFLNGATVLIGPPATNVSVPDSTHIDATTGADNPGTIVDVKITLPDTTVIFLYGGYFYDFLDVPAGDIFEPYVRKLVANGVTSGCGGGDYCRNDPVKRKQMAVFALKAKNGSGYVPPAAVGIFTDVPPTDPFAPWIEELYNLGVVTGCAPGPMYCPDNPVLRQQMPVFLLKTLEGSGYVPPACTGLFGDVPCPSPFANWIEDVANRGIAGGCGGGNFCPGNPTTRGQMAPFLVKTFQLP
jgi:uncharacterized repeat protein (TIGR03803 family)